MGYRVNFTRIRDVEGNEIRQFHIWSAKANSNFSFTTNTYGDPNSLYADVEDAVEQILNLPTGSATDVVLIDDDKLSQYPLNTFQFRPDLSEANIPLKSQFHNLGEIDKVKQLKSLDKQIRWNRENNEKLNKDGFDKIASTLRMCDVKELDQLNDYKTPNNQRINISEYVNLEYFIFMDQQGKDWFRRRVPQVSQYINLDDLSTITQQQIDSFINAVPNLAELLNLKKFNKNIPDDFTVLPNKLGDEILQTDGFIEEFEKIQKNRNINTTQQDVFQNNQQTVETSIGAHLISDDNFETLWNNLETKDVFTNPYNVDLVRCKKLIQQLEYSLKQIDVEQTPELVDYWPWVFGDGERDSLGKLVEDFQKHTDLLSNVNQNTSQTDTSFVITNEKNLSTIIDDAKIIPPNQQSFSQLVASVAVNMQAILTTLASGHRGDCDGLYNKKFNGNPLETMMGSVTHRSLILDFVTFCESLENVIQYEISPKEKSNRIDDINSEIKNLIFKQNSVSNSSLILEKLNYKKTFIENRAGSLTPSDLKPALIDAKKWLLWEIQTFRKKIANTIQVELYNFQRYRNLVRKYFQTQSTESTGALLTSTMTADTNLAAQKTQYDQQSLYSEADVDYSEVEKLFPSEFQLDGLIDIAHDGSKQIKKILRDGNGEVVVVNPDTIATNLLNIVKDILIPLNAAGYKFKIISGYRRFVPNPSAKPKFIDSDHNYGLAVDLQFVDRQQTGKAATFIKTVLPWNRLILYNWNERLQSNSDSFLHISYYGEQQLDWGGTRNSRTYPLKNGQVERLGGDGFGVEGFDG